MKNSTIQINAPKGASEKTATYCALLQKGKPFEAFLHDNSQSCFQACICKLVDALAKAKALDSLPAYMDLLGLANHSAAKQSMSSIEIVDESGKLQSLSAHWSKGAAKLPTKLDLSLLD